MWQTGGGAKPWRPSLTEDSQTKRERSRSLCTSSCIMLRTNSSYDEEEIKELLQLELFVKAEKKRFFRFRESGQQRL